MNQRPKPFVRMMIAFFFFLSAVTLYIVLPRYWHSIPEIIKHLLLVFSAIMCVHIMEYAYLWWEIFGHIRGILKETLQATHQLIEENKVSLEKSLQATNQLIGSASTCGLTNIYSSRKIIKGNIYDAIENAGKRIWLLGITLSEGVRLDELLSILKEKTAAGADVRILLLDVLQDAGVFRTLMESDAREAASVIRADRTITQPADPFFHQRLYSDFAHACNRLRCYPGVGERVRFYTHTPNCWMVIVDDTAHYQPYTFGQTASQRSAKRCFGDNMPVFKFQKQPGGMPFEILEDHFSNLWMTSDMDLFHIEARIADRNRIIKGIFDNRLAWFNHVYNVMYPSRENVTGMAERRRHTRSTWKWKQPPLSICQQEGNTTVTCFICNYSREGLALKVQVPVAFQKGDIIFLVGDPPAEPLEANFIINHFLKISKFVVTRVVNGEQTIIGLQSFPEDKRRQV